MGLRGPPGPTGMQGDSGVDGPKGSDGPIVSIIYQLNSCKL